MEVRATWGRWQDWRKVEGRWWFSGTLDRDAGTVVENRVNTTSGFWTVDPVEVSISNNLLYRFGSDYVATARAKVLLDKYSAFMYKI